MNETRYNISSSPHLRSPLTTAGVMIQVIISLLPATFFGIWRYGLNAFVIIALAILSCVLSELLFDLIAKKGLTIKDGSAVVTGLLLALSLSPSCPWYIPVIGGAFAILVVKCFFGGLGKNFMNPALAARCFLLISFGSAMTAFPADAVSSATPLAALRSGEVIRLTDTFLGYSSSVIGGSALALLIGGIFLLITGGITITIPASVILSFTAFMLIFGGEGFSMPFALANLFAGGILMGGIFMATDPVTSPMTEKGQVIFGVVIGVLAGLFRVKGSAADSVSYAIIITNMLVPFLDRMKVRKPLGYKEGEYKERQFPKSAVNLFVITLLAGLALSGVFEMTKEKIEDQKKLEQAQSYKAVMPDADSFTYDPAIEEKVAALPVPYDSAYGRTWINEVATALDASGNAIGYVLNVSSGDGYEGEIAMSVGLDLEGTVTSVAFTELNETAGMGMRADEPEFKNQFKDIRTDAFVLNKTGNGTEPGEVNTISGASTTSGAVVNAVNTALDFYRTLSE